MGFTSSGIHGLFALLSYMSKKHFPLSSDPQTSLTSSFTEQIEATGRELPKSPSTTSQSGAVEKRSMPLGTLRCLGTPSLSPTRMMAPTILPSLSLRKNSFSPPLDGTSQHTDKLLILSF